MKRKGLTEQIADAEREILDEPTLTEPCPHDTPASREVMMGDNSTKALATEGDLRGAEETLDASDLVVPRANLLQPTSAELNVIGSDLRAGTVINSLTKEVLPEKFIPIFYWKEFTRFNPRKKDDIGYDANYAPGALIFTTRDINDPKVVEFCNGDDSMLYHIRRITFFAVFDGQTMPVLLSFGKTSYKSGMLLYTLIKMRKKPAFYQKFKLSVVPGNPAKGSYFLLKVNLAGDCSPDEFKMGEEYFQQFGMKREVLESHIETE